MKSCNIDISNASFLVLSPGSPLSFNQCCVVSFNTIYKAVVEKMQQDGVIPYVGED